MPKTAVSPMQLLGISAGFAGASCAHVAVQHALEPLHIAHSLQPLATAALRAACLLPLPTSALELLGVAGLLFKRLHNGGEGVAASSAEGKGRYVTGTLTLLSEAVLLYGFAVRETSVSQPLPSILFSARTAAAVVDGDAFNGSRSQRWLMFGRCVHAWLLRGHMGWQTLSFISFRSFPFRILCRYLLAQLCLQLLLQRWKTRRSKQREEQSLAAATAAAGGSDARTSSRDGHDDPFQAPPSILSWCSAANLSRALHSALEGPLYWCTALAAFKALQTLLQRTAARTTTTTTSNVTVLSTAASCRGLSAVAAQLFSALAAVLAGRASSVLLRRLLVSPSHESSDATSVSGIAMTAITLAEGLCIAGRLCAEFLEMKLPSLLAGPACAARSRRALALLLAAAGLYQCRAYMDGLAVS